MATIKSFTSLEQSKKLAEILPIESADMWWVALNWQETEYYVEVKQDGINQPKKAVPCWSLVALLSVLPNSIYDNTNEFSQLEFTKKSIAYIHGITGGIKIGALKDNLIDTCYEVILKLHKLKLL